MENLKKIAEFLNVPESTLEAQPLDLIVKMVKAVEDEDMFELHHLGYSINSTT